MPWRYSGDEVSVQIRTHGFPTAMQAVLQWPQCVGRTAESPPQLEFFMFGRDRIERRLGISIEDVSRFELLDEVARMAIDERLAREEGFQGRLAHGPVCLERFVEFDEHGEVVVGRRCVDCEPQAFAAVVQEFTGALAREMYIDSIRRAALGLTDHGMDYVTASNLRDTEEEAIFLELALVLTDTIMELDVLTAETFTDMCDLELSIAQLARALAWRMIDGGASGRWVERGHRASTQVTVDEIGPWTDDYIEWFESLDIPFVGYDESLINRIAYRLDGEWWV